MPENNITFFSIATNQYLELWKNQVSSVSSHIERLQWRWIVLTDDPCSARSFIESKNMQDFIDVRDVLPFGFPLASMIRYSAILHNFDKEGWICYIDADMRIEKPEKLDSQIRSSSQVSVVSHPGFSRPKGIVWSLGLRSNVSNLLRHLALGGLGSWEIRRKSKAFVPRWARKVYVQAAIFFGPAESVLQLSADCWNWTEQDMRMGVIPIWHDESYLNRWLVDNPYTLVGPEFCYFDFPWLAGKSPVVRAIDKSLQSAHYERM